MSGAPCQGCLPLGNSEEGDGLLEGGQDVGAHGGSRERASPADHDCSVSQLHVPESPGRLMTPESPESLRGGGGSPAPCGDMQERAGPG